MLRTLHLPWDYNHLSGQILMNSETFEMQWKFPHRSLKHLLKFERWDAICQKAIRESSGQKKKGEVFIFYFKGIAAICRGQAFLSVKSEAAVFECEREGRQVRGVLA